VPLTEFSYFLRAPRDRVWRAVGDAGQFGIWFGAEIDGPFTAGVRRTGRIVPTKVHPGIGRAQKPYLGTVFELEVERVQPQRLLSFRWHPLGEPETLVSFEVADAAGGVALTVAESDSSPCLWPPREMALLIEKFLAGAVDLRR
jgi:uncharacterized protein YndB with AHSA1/START domain